MAARRPAALSPQTLIQRLKRERPPAVVVVAGAEAWFRDAVVDALTRAWFPDGDPGGAIIRLDGRRTEDAAAIESTMDELRATSLFAARRLVRIDEPDAARRPAPGKALRSTQLAKEAMAEAVEGSLLLLVSRRGVKGKGSVGTTALNKAGAWVVDCRALYDAPAPWERGKRPHDHELARHLVQRMKSAHGRQLDLLAAHELTQRVGSSLHGLEQALAQLALTAETGTITADKVQDLLGESRNDALWPLGDAILDGHVADAAARVDRAFARGIPGEKGQPIVQPSAVFAMLHASLRMNLRRAWRASEALAGGMPPGEVAKAVGAPPFAAEALLRRARTPPVCFVRAHRALFQGAHGVQSGRVTPRVAGERMVVAMAQALSRG